MKTYKELVDGYKVLGKNLIDPEEYPPMRDMEGPFYFHEVGMILYYDMKAGLYYDRKTDIYMDRDFDPNRKQKHRGYRSEGFSPAQIKALKQEFGKIKRVDPESPTMKKMKMLLQNLPPADLEIIEKANIPFVSGLASSIRILRKHEK